MCALAQSAICTCAYALYTLCQACHTERSNISEFQCIAHDMHTLYARFVKHVVLNTVIISECQCINTKLAAQIPHSCQILALVLAPVHYESLTCNLTKQKNLT